MTRLLVLLLLAGCTTPPDYCTVLKPYPASVDDTSATMTAAQRAAITWARYCGKKH